MNPPTDESYTNFQVYNQSAINQLVSQTIDTHSLYVNGKKIENNSIPRGLEQLDNIWLQAKQFDSTECEYFFETNEGNAMTLNLEMEIIGEESKDGMSTVATLPSTYQNRNRGFTSLFTVGTTATNSNYTSIQSAINSAIAGGGTPVIYIRNGTFTENVVINTTIPLIIFSESAIIDGSIDITNISSQISIIGLTFIGNNNFGLRIRRSTVNLSRCTFNCVSSTSSIVFDETNYFVMINCTISGSNTGISGTSIIYTQISTSEFTNSVYSLNLTGPPEGGNGAALYLLATLKCTNILLTDTTTNLCESTAGTVTTAGSFSNVLITSSVVNAVTCVGNMSLTGTRVVGAVTYSGTGTVFFRSAGSSMATFTSTFLGGNPQVHMVGTDIISSSACSLSGSGGIILVSCKIQCSTFTLGANTATKMVNTQFVMTGAGPSTWGGTSLDINSIEISSTGGYTLDLTSLTRTIISGALFRNIIVAPNTTGIFSISNSRFQNTNSANCLLFGASANSNYMIYNNSFSCPITAISVGNATTGLKIANCDFTATGTGPVISFTNTTVVSFVFNCVFNNSAGGVVCISNSGGTATHQIGGNQVITGTPTSGSFTIIPFNQF